MIIEEDCSVDFSENIGKFRYTGLISNCFVVVNIFRKVFLVNYVLFLDYNTYQFSDLKAIVWCSLVSVSI